MKRIYSLCFFLLLSCGSPLDEGYWKEHNSKVEPSDNNEERTFSIDFESLQQGIDMAFSGESLRRLAEQKVRITVNFNRPSTVRFTEFQIRNDACPAPSHNNTIPNADTSNTIDETLPLSTVSQDTTRNLEDQYIYFRGTVSSGSAVIDLACSRIRL